MTPRRPRIPASSSALVPVLVLVLAMCAVLLTVSTSPAAEARADEVAARDHHRAAGPTVLLKMRDRVSSQGPVKAKVVVRSVTAHRAGRAVIRSSDGAVLATGHVKRGRRTVTRLVLPALAPGEHVLRALFRPRAHGQVTRSDRRSIVAVDKPAATKPPGSSTTDPSLRDCAAVPSSCGYPDTTNTGVTPGTTLTTINGSLDLRTPGQVLENVIVTGHVNIWAQNVTLRNVRITNTGQDWGIGLNHSVNATITDTEILPAGPRLEVGIKDVYGDAQGTTIRRTEVTRTSSGIQTHEGLIADSYVHDMGFMPGDHLNGTTSNGSDTPLTIQHNTIFNNYGQTDAISLFQDFGLEANRTVFDNLLAGGGYTIYAGGGGFGTSHDISISANRFARLYFPNGGSYGPVAAYDAGGTNNTWNGNYWDDTGAVVRP